MVRYEDGEHTIHSCTLLSDEEGAIPNNTTVAMGCLIHYKKSEHQALQFQALGGGAPLSGWLAGGMPDMNPILPMFEPTTRGDQLH